MKLFLEFRAAYCLSRHLGWIDCLKCERAVPLAGLKCLLAWWYHCFGRAPRRLFRPTRLDDTVGLPVALEGQVGKLFIFVERCSIIIKKSLRLLVLQMED